MYYYFVGESPLRMSLVSAVIFRSIILICEVRNINVQLLASIQQIFVYVVAILLISRLKEIIAAKVKPLEAAISVI